MANDRIALSFGGAISLDNFARTVTFQSRLLNLLSANAEGPSVTWRISLEQPELGTLIAFGVGPIDKVEAVVDAYSAILDAVSTRQALNVRPEIAAASVGLFDLKEPALNSLNFTTNTGQWKITPRLVDFASSPQDPAKDPTGKQAPLARAGQARVLETVGGRIRTISDRQGLRAVLLDEVSGRSVVCRLDEGREEWARRYWGNAVFITGYVRRDRSSGRPLDVTDFEEPTLRPPSEPGTWQLALMRARSTKQRKRK